MDIRDIPDFLEPVDDHSFFKNLEICWVEGCTLKFVREKIKVWLTEQESGVFGDFRGQFFLTRTVQG